MLLQNLARECEYPFRQSGYSNQNLITCWGLRSDTNLNRYVSSAGMAAFNAIPSGYTPGYAWGQARKSGGASLYYGANGVAAISPANLYGGFNLNSTITNIGDITTTQGSMVINGMATILAAASSSATLTGALEASGTITALGDFVTAIGELIVHADIQANITDSIGSIVTALGELLVHSDMQATLVGYGDITPIIGLLVDIVSTILAQATISAVPRADAFMSATVYVNQSTASVEQIVAGVWDALCVDFNESGSMGEAVAAAGTAGDPWTTSLPGGYSGDQAGSIIGSQLLTTGKFIALK